MVDANTILIAASAVTVALLVLYGCLFIAERKPFFLLWVLSIISLLAAYLSRLAINLRGDEDILIIANYISTVLGYWLTYKGIMSYFEHKSQWYLDLPPCLLGALFVIFKVFDTSVFVILALSTAYGTALLVVTGLITLQAKKPTGIIRRVLACTFFVWAFFSLLYPLTTLMKVLPSYLGYLCTGVLGLIALVSIQSMYFEGIKQEIQRRENNIRKLIVFDKLTGVYNRSYFEQAREDFFKSYPVVLIMGDVNGLKLINDTFGHEKGDAFLIDTVNIIKSTISVKNYIIRWGGDEFIILLPNSSLEEAERIISHIKINMKAHSRLSIPNDISLGAAVVHDSQESVTEIIQQAEQRMYSRKLHESKESRMAIIHFLVELLCEKGGHPHDHLERLKGLVTEVGAYLNLSQRELDDLVQVAVLHDIGKTGIPLDILNKEGNMTAEEWEILKKHTEIGCRITQASRELAHISKAILAHHEWWNGTGYPQGLSGEDIPLYARILSIADRYDCLTHDRPNRPAIAPALALSCLQSQSGTRYDPYLVDVFCQIMHYPYPQGKTCQVFIN